MATASQFDFSDEDDTGRLPMPLTPSQLYMSAFDSAAQLGYSTLMLTEAGNPGAFDTFIAWCEVRGVVPVRQTTAANENGAYELAHVKVGAAHLEVVRRVR